jgi:ADP-heptose:LPS heptosyltransferase
MKILIIQTGLPGDVVFSLPVIRALKKVSESDVELIVRAGHHEPILQQEGGLNVHTLESWWSMISKLAGKRYDVIVDLSPEIGSRILTLAIRGRVLSLRSRFFRSKLERALATHKTDAYLTLVKPITGSADSPSLSVSIEYKDEVPLDWLPSGFDKGYIVFCIGAPYPTRRLPMNRMIELCDKINGRIILVGGAEFSADGEAIERFFARSNEGDLEEGLLALNKKAVVYNGCGKFSVLQQTSIVKQARHVFTFDNEFIAIASALQKPTICIMGNTTAGHGGYPYNVQFTLLENNKLDCRPCSARGHAKCPLGHFKCMTEVTFDFYMR